MLQVTNDVFKGVQEIGQVGYNSVKEAISKEALQRIGFYGTLYYLSQGAVAQSDQLTNSTPGTIIFSSAIATVGVVASCSMLCCAAYLCCVKSDEAQQQEKFETGNEAAFFNNSEDSVDTDLDVSELDGSRNDNEAGERSPLKDSPVITLDFSTPRKQRKEDSYDEIDLFGSGTKKKEKQDQYQLSIAASKSENREEKEKKESSCIIS